MTLDEAIETVKRELPGWWWKVGSCCVSDDACIAPDFNDPIHGERLKAELFPIDAGSELDAGFDIDQRPPGDVAGALLKAIAAAKTYLADRIPADIHAASAAVVENILYDARMTLMGDVDKMVPPIAAAILAERERCASIIEQRPLAIPDRQELAAFVRSGGSPADQRQSPDRRRG